MPDSTPPTAPVSSNAPAAKRKPSNLRLRLIWGIIGAALLLGCVWFGPWTFGLFFGLVQAIMLWEFYRMMRAGGYAPAAWIGVGVSVYVFAISAILKFNMYADITRIDFATAGNPGWHTVILPFAWILGPFLLLPVLLMLREMLLWPRYDKPFSNIGVTLAGLVYVSLPMCLLIGLAYNFALIPDNYNLSAGSVHPNAYDYRRVFALLFLIWASDIGAFAAGKTFGKHKMAPRISPAKTWEGWAGGFLLTLLVGWALGSLLPDLPLAHRLVAAGVVAVFAPLGDLAESMLKRSVGVKDSGSIMPGHGGLLDRFDAFLLVLPVLALLQLLAG
ncbi:phosphatidate cytidylyltransferase [Hymenobacter sp.]|uniref:phosphatidate cytidylyltransferase n=1 Tax=Hymenobacter sp. TaxID=1898978 RepID=UPI00286B34ED|nr:phosphatidate cytidylyltransferase [Hymenobacter sp.]